MNKLLVFVTFVLIYIASSAQYLYIGTSTVIPKVPSKKDSVKIHTYTATSYPSNQLSRSFSIDTLKKIIDIEFCYYIVGFSFPVSPFYFDIFSIGQLDTGIYQVNIKSILSSSSSVCVTYTTIANTFTFAVNDNITGYKSIKEGTIPITVFPNPVKDELRFESQIREKINLSLTNTLGKVVYSEVNIDLKKDLDVSFLTSGVYYLRLQNDKAQKVLKIVKD